MAGVCFVDESVEASSGIACMCGVCLPSRACASRMLETLKKMVGWRRGEVKFRKLLRAVGDPGEAVRLIETVLRSDCVLGYECVSIELSGGVLDGEARLTLLTRLLGLLVVYGPGEVVLDEAPISDKALGRARRRAGLRSRVRMRPSHREPGLQLADLLAGARCKNS